MTGQELIDWIREHNAGDLEMIVEHRDSGGTYYTAERLEGPQLVRMQDELYGVIYSIEADKEKPNAVLL